MNNTDLHEEITTLQAEFVATPDSMPPVSAPQYQMSDGYPWGMP
ncbi:hypothetical protein A2U01_0043202, partial [Trifolium medium]|nr:hypothetical protein [Trifolium medium]